MKIMSGLVHLAVTAHSLV